VTGRRRAPEAGPGAAPEGAAGVVTTAAGIPAWLAPSAGRPDPRVHVGANGWPTTPPRGTPVPVGATRALDPDRWRRELVLIVRTEWLAGVAGVIGLGFARTAPYTAGLLAGAVVVAAAYGRLRWQALGAPPTPHRTTAYVAVLTVLVALAAAPAAAVGALTLARLAVIAAVTCATYATLRLAPPRRRSAAPER
jgi:hypothetical protein